MFTVSDHDEDAVAAITNGADGFLLKDMEPEDTIEKVRQAALGKMVITMLPYIKKAIIISAMERLSRRNRLLTSR